METPIMFYLTSTEISPTIIPRKCIFLEKLWSDERKDFFLRLKIEPFLMGNFFGIKQERIDEIVIATRHSGTSLSPISEFPIVVFVCYLINPNIRLTGKVSSEDIQMLFIGEIYDNFSNAEQAICHETMRF